MKTNKLMITCALCGGGTTRKQSPYVPLTPEELVADSLAAVRARRLHPAHPCPR